MEVHFLQVLLISDFKGLGSFYHLAAVFVGSMEPVNVGVNGSVSLCFLVRNLLAWQLLLGRSQQDQALSVLRSAG